MFTMFMGRKKRKEKKINKKNESSLGILEHKTIHTVVAVNRLKVDQGGLGFESLIAGTGVKMLSQRH